MSYVERQSQLADIAIDIPLHVVYRYSNDKEGTNTCVDDQLTDCTTDN